MKSLVLTPILFLASCASPTTPEVLVKPKSGLSADAVENLRFAEVLRAYHIGRYVDPNNPELMHEQHPVYRVEAYTRWNLKPGSSIFPGTGSAVGKDAAYSVPPTNDIVIAELNRQKEATERVMWEASRLARSYDDLQKVLNEMTSIVTNQALMNSRLFQTERHVAQFEEKVQRLSLPSPASTNEVPPSSEE